MKNTCNNGECHVLYVSVNNKFHTYEGSVSGKNPWRKLVLIVSDVTGSFASMRITFLVRSRCQKNSSALMVFTFRQVFKTHDLCSESVI